MRADHTNLEPRVAAPRSTRVVLAARQRLMAILVSGLVFASCSAHETPKLRIFAAASLQELAADLAALYEEHHGVETELNVAGSHVLARQIARAPAAADVFLSADPELVQELIDAGHLSPESHRLPWRNSLVVAARRDSELRLGSAAGLLDSGIDHVAIGDPEGVPAGRYARAALDRPGSDLWQRLTPRLVPMPDVRAALALAAADTRTVAIVYRTDVAVVPGMTVLTSLESPTPIAYAVGATTAGRRQLATSFIALLDDDAARQCASQRGFELG